MEHEFWHQKWQQKDIGFNLSDYHPYLTKHFPGFKISKGKRVFVPLCGKSCDLRWLLDAGYQVAGLELNAKAIKEFFKDQQIEMRVEEGRSLPCYMGKGVDIYCGDFFAISRKDLGEVSAVYDRAALEALPPAVRSRYSKHLLSLIDPGTPILTVIHEYDQQEMDGPPFSVTGEELSNLHKDCQSLEMLESANTLHREEKLRERGLTGLCEVAWKTIR